MQMSIICFSYPTDANLRCFIGICSFVYSVSECDIDEFTQLAAARDSEASVSCLEKPSTGTREAAYGQLSSTYELPERWNAKSRSEKESLCCKWAG